MRVEREPRTNTRKTTPKLQGVWAPQQMAKRIYIYYYVYLSIFDYLLNITYYMVWLGKVQVSQPQAPRFLGIAPTNTGLNLTVTQSDSGGKKSHRERRLSEAEAL